MSSVVRQRTCRQCGAVFPGGPRAWYCPACREERRREANRRYKAKGANRPLGSTDYCIVCGAPYTVAGGRQKYCPKCAPDAIRAIHNAQSRAWNAENATPEYRRALRDKAVSPRNCVICGAEFRPRNSSVTCSPQCSKELKKRNMTNYETSHRAEINARRAERRRQKLAAMTPEELAAYRDKVNSRARDHYRKRKDDKK